MVRSTKPQPADELIRAVTSGDQSFVEKWIKEGRPIDSVGSSNATALFIATKLGNVEMMRRLLDAGASPNTVLNDAIGKTFEAAPRCALNLAMDFGELEVINLLIDYGANPLMVNQDRQSALHLAVGSAFKRNSLINSETEFWDTVDGLIDRLVQAGAKINQRALNSNTPLDLALLNEVAPRTISKLLDLGADVSNMRRPEGSPLALAAYHATPEIIRLLVERGAPVDGESENGETALFSFKTPEVGRCLLELGANIEHRCIHGRTALASHLSNMHVGQEVPDAVKFLVEAGADTNAQDYEGVTPRDIARRRRQKDVTSFFNAAEARVAMLRATRPGPRAMA